MTPKEVKLTIYALMTALLLGALDQTIVTTALPTIVSKFGGASHLSWVITAYLLATTATTPLYGKIGDLYGRKKILIVAVVIFLLGSILCGLATSMTTLILARFIQGIGAGGLFPLVLATIADIVSLKDRAKYQGAFGAVFGISSVVGPLLGGFLTQAFSWRSIFYINLPIGILAIFLIEKNLHGKENKNKHVIDYLGSFLIALFTTTLLLVTVWGGKQYPWFSPIIITLALTSLLSLVFFLFHESRHPEPIIPLRIFKIKGIPKVSIISFLTGLSLFGSLVYITIFLQVVLGFSPTKSGVALIPLSLGMFPSSIFAGKFISRTGKYKVLPITGSIIISGIFFLMGHIRPDTAYLTIALLLFTLGLSLGTLIQIPSLVSQNLVEKSDIGVATSTVTFTRSIGASFGTAFFGTILNSRLSHHLANLSPGENKPRAIESFAAISKLPPPLRNLILKAFTHSIDDIFLTALPFALLLLVISLTLPNKSLLTQGSNPTDSGH